MDQQQNRQPGAHNNGAPAPIAPNPHGIANGANLHQNDGTGGQGMTPQHLVELMTNPNLAAAAAASPLLPPAAMMTNPGAVYAMPDVFTSNTGLNHQSANSLIPLQHVAGQTGIPMTNQQVYQFQLGQQAAQMQALGSGGFQLQPGMGVPMNVATAHGTSSGESNGGAETKKGRRKKDLTPEERAKRNRDRNREHAKSTRQRKKAFIQHLKELVEGMQAERTEEVRQRRVAIQRLADMQNVRRGVIHSFLRYLSNYERDKRKWSTLLEDDFWLKQPVTPYRCFRRSEIEKVRMFCVGSDVDSFASRTYLILIIITNTGKQSLSGY